MNRQWYTLLLSRGMAQDYKHTTTKLAPCRTHKKWDRISICKLGRQICQCQWRSLLSLVPCWKLKSMLSNAKAMLLYGLLCLLCRGVVVVVFKQRFLHLVRQICSLSNVAELYGWHLAESQSKFEQDQLHKKGSGRSDRIPTAMHSGRFDAGIYVHLFLMQINDMK